MKPQPQLGWEIHTTLRSNSSYIPPWPQPEGPPRSLQLPRHIPFARPNPRPSPLIPFPSWPPTSSWGQWSELWRRPTDPLHWGGAPFGPQPTSQRYLGQLQCFFSPSPPQAAYSWALEFSFRPYWRPIRWRCTSLPLLSFAYCNSWLSLLLEMRLEHSTKERNMD